MTTLTDAALEALRGVIDPELGVNVVDLGLVYGIDPSSEGGLEVRMTLTTPGCPLHASLAAAVERAIRRGVPEAQPVDVRLVWDPPWCPDRITDEGKRQLGWQC